MDITYYERKFDELSRYAPRLVDTKEKRARRFERRLHLEIRQIVSVLELPTYGEVVRKAQAVTYSGVTYEGRGSQGNLQSQGKRKWQGPNQNQSRGQAPNKRPNQGTVGGQPANSTRTPCPKCQKMHKGECLLGKNVCFKYGKPGHYANECRAPPAQSTNQAKGKEPTKMAKARVFAMDVADDSNVIASTSLISVFIFNL